MDNQDPATDNQDPATETPAVPEGSTGQTDFSWKGQLGSDVMNSPLVQKFEDTQDGMNKAFESHANLEQLLGHEKVPIPKGVEDVEGWNRFSKAMGIPDKAEGYGLPDANLPESMKGMTIDKNQFAEVVHAHKLTPAQAKGLWESYSKIQVDTFQKFSEGQEKQLSDTINSLKGKWGDTYDTNVELGQSVINKFSNDQEMNDYLTSMLSKDSRGIEFLAKVGEQFAENKIGNFEMKRFSLAPEEAAEEIEKMTRDLDGPYMNSSGKHTEREHQAAMDRRNHLQNVINRANQG